MPDLLALAALPPSAHWMPTLTDLAKILGVPVAMFLMARFITLRDKKREKETADKEAAAAEETRLLKEAKELATAERAALRAEIAAMKLEMAGLGIHNKGIDKALDRIEVLLSKMIDNYHKLS